MPENITNMWLVSCARGNCEVQMNGIDKIKARLLDVRDITNSMSNPWNEGYISALCDHKVITEGEFDEIMTWLKSCPR